MKKVVVEIDCREKHPLLFPTQLIWSRGRGSREMVAVETVGRQLRFGDYRLAQAPNAVVIERKGSLDEIAQNLLTRDHLRFREAWNRLITGCDYPVLAIDGSIATFDKLRGNYPDSITPEVVQCALWRWVAVHKVPVIWLGNTTTINTRRAVGAQLLRLMLALRFGGVD